MHYVRGGTVRVSGNSRRLPAATALVAVMSTGAYAQGAADQGQQQAATPPSTAAAAIPPAVTITSVIEANLAQPGQICPACTPLIIASPAAAAEMIAAAQKYPELAETLAQCLSKLQQGMAATNPQGAQAIAALVTNAPPAFQAAYAVAAAGDGGGGGGDGGGGGGGAGAGGGGGGGAGAGGGGGGAGGGGGGFGG